MSFGRVPYDVDASASGPRLNNIISSVGHTAIENQSNNFLKEHINREHAQYGLTKTEKLGTWAFGDDLTDNDFHPTEVRWKHYTRQRARSARREPRPKLGGDAGRRCRVPVELSDAAGKASFPPGTFKGSATSHKFASQNASGHQTSGASTTPVFRASIYSAMWSGNNPYYSGQVATLMNPPLKTQAKLPFNPNDTSYAKAYNSQRTGAAHDDIPNGIQQHALRRRPSSATEPSQVEKRGGDGGGQVACRSTVHRPTSAKPTRPQSAHPRLLNPNVPPPWKTNTPAYRNKRPEEEAFRRGTNHFGKSIWNGASSRLRDAALGRQR
mmetsp:Transcript_20921/g.39766  ORF Transcript_20921/g.39766 Transcript_20921/m.39766 type:complete len:325 (+) Transcript_20921:290-1264(+)